MFKSISRFKQADRAIKQIVKLEHRLRVASSRTNCSDQPSKFKVDFTESPGKSTLASVIRSAFVTKPSSTHDEFGVDPSQESAKSMPDTSSPFSVFKERVSECNNLASLLRLIEPELAGWRGSDELRIVYHQINHLFFHLVLNARSSSELKREVRASAVLQRLLDHTDNLVKQLSTGCLITLFETFDWIDLDPQSQLFRNTLNELNRRLNRLEFTEIIKCLNLLVYHLEKPFATAELFKCSDRFSQTAMLRIMSEDLSVQPVETIIKCFFCFLNCKHDSGHEVIDILVERLQSPHIQLSYKQSVRLLKEIQKNYILFKKRNEAIRYPTGLANLIEKCNTTIHRAFAVSGSTDEELYYYLVNLHRYTMPNEFSKVVPNFYDQSQNRLFAYLIPFLLDQFNFNERLGFYLFNLSQNYANFNIYDARLFRLIYRLFARDENLRARLNVCHFYRLLARYKLPYVHHANLAKLFLPMLTDKSHKSFYSGKKDRLVLLNNLLLNDVANEELFDYLVGQLNDLDEQFFKQLDFRELQKLTLAKACLVEFNHLDEEHKLKIRSKLDEIIDGCVYYMSIGISNRFFVIDPRLQRHGFLSNGVHLDPFGIYDHATKELVPLTSYTDCFYQIERIPPRLPKNQEM